MKQIPVEIQLERLPEFWDRSVIFFANLHALFFGNEAETDALNSQVRGIEAYGARLLSIVDLLYRGGDNLLMIESPPCDSLIEYLRDDLKLNLPDYHIVRPDEYPNFLERLQNANHELFSHPAECLDGFVTDIKLAEIGERLKKPTVSSHPGSQNGNNKFKLYQFKKSVGLPVFETRIGENPIHTIELFKNLKTCGYKKAVVKAQIGASGCGIEIYSTDQDDPNSIPEFLFFEGPVLVQGWLDDSQPGIEVLCSPSVQMFVAEDRAALFDITEQILSEASVHEGNISPPPFFENHPEFKDEMLHQAGIAAQYLHSLGYRGTASSDFVVYLENGESKAVLCEINARVTGATYPSLLGKHFNPDGAWLLRNLKLNPALPPHVLFQVLESEKLLFKPERKKGILPFNFSYTEDGDVRKGQFVCLGKTAEECFEILKSADESLPVKTEAAED